MDVPNEKRSRVNDTFSSSSSNSPPSPKNWFRYISTVCIGLILNYGCEDHQWFGPNSVSWVCREFFAAFRLSTLEPCVHMHLVKPKVLARYKLIRKLIIDINGLIRYAHTTNGYKDVLNKVPNISICPWPLTELEKQDLGLIKNASQADFVQFNTMLFILGNLVQNRSLRCFHFDKEYSNRIQVDEKGHRNWLHMHYLIQGKIFDTSWNGIERFNDKEPVHEGDYYNEGKTFTVHYLIDLPCAGDGCKAEVEPRMRHPIGSGDDFEDCQWSQCYGKNCKRYYCPDHGNDCPLCQNRNCLQCMEKCAVCNLISCCYDVCEGCKRVICNYCQEPLGNVFLCVSCGPTWALL